MQDPSNPGLQELCPIYPLPGKPPVTPWLCAIGTVCFSWWSMTLRGNSSMSICSNTFETISMNCHHCKRIITLPSTTHSVGACAPHVTALNKEQDWKEFTRKKRTHTSKIFPGTQEQQPSQNLTFFLTRWRVVLTLPMVTLQTKPLESRAFSSSLVTGSQSCCTFTTQLLSNCHSQACLCPHPMS